MKDNIKQYDTYVVRLPKEAERKNGAGKLNGCYFFKTNGKDKEHILKVSREQEHHKSKNVYLCFSSHLILYFQNTSTDQNWEGFPTPTNSVT